MESLQYARKIVDAASDKQATDILLLDIRNVGTFADFFVIMTADNRRQMNALQEDLVDTVEKAGATLHHQEGTAESGWVLLDFGDVIVHLFAPQERAYYRLEDLWARGQQIVRIQ
ncbi:MAG: ribosome silencing factor [Chloroflexi bacterium]|nr:ribosome silencing factor [Chloroflexota bacterium]